jgi:hypothetical protein
LFFQIMIYSYRGNAQNAVQIWIYRGLFGRELYRWIGLKYNRFFIFNFSNLYYPTSKI